MSRPGRTRASARSFGGLAPPIVAFVLAACPRPSPQSHGQPTIVADPLSDAARPASTKAYEDALLVTAQTRCDWSVRCGWIAASQRANCELGPPPAGKLALVWGDPRNDNIHMSLVDGRVELDPTAVSRCVEAFRTAPCHPDGKGSPWTQCALLKPKVAPGGKCRFWSECIDAHCSGQTACEGQCVAHLERGAPCTSSGNEGLCGDQDFCEPDKGLCVPRLGEGAACVHWQSCSALMRCEGVMKVRDHPHTPELIVPGKCTMPGTKGVACRPGWNDCAPTFACDFATSTCMPRVAKGGSCTSPDSCVDGQACVGLVAGWSSSAKWAVTKGAACGPHLDLGASCDPLSSEPGCPRSTVCDPTSKSCVSSAHEGDPCHPNGGCNSNLYCHPKTKRCVPALPIGASCTPPATGDDSPCFISACDPKTLRCTPRCPT